MKRAFDFVFSIIGIVMLSPVMMVISILIKLEDHGSVLYGGERVGLNGRLFRLWKFRTMVVNADKIGGFTASDRDPRITKVGSRLRRWKLDELPQLWNVVTGDMSLVGPRPEVKHYVDMFSEEERRILAVRPGITDWACLMNPDEGKFLKDHPDPERGYMELIRPTKIRLQLAYVQRHSFSTDIGILISTLKVLLFRSRPNIPLN